MIEQQTLEVSKTSEVYCRIEAVPLRGTPNEYKMRYTLPFDRFYSRFVSAYDWFLKAIPLWRNWLKHAVPRVQGTRVLEVSFGTGYHLTQYADRFQTYGIDYNQRMVTIAKD
jgi:ubiquinone/menaquinone biosynthesis C-methylase UbiE